MKKITYFLFFLLISSRFVFSQGPGVPTRAPFFNVNSSHFGQGEFFRVFDKSSEKIEGTRFLFKKFENRSVIIDSNDKEFLIRNLNIDLLNKKFVSQFSKDSLFIFNNLKAAYINGDKYENFNGEIFKTIYKGKEFGLYEKLYKKKIDRKVDKRGLIISEAKWSLNKAHYVFKKGKLKMIKLNKKNILRIIENENYKKKLLNFSKENNLSFKKDKDINKILKYYNSL